MNRTTPTSKYRVYLRTVASTTIEVEASSEEEAIEAAFKKTPYLCAQCSGWGNSAGIELADWDTVDQPWTLGTDVAVEAVDA